MIPLWDNIPTLRLPVVTYALLAINMIVFAYEWSLGAEGLDHLLTTWGYVPAALTETVRSGAFDPMIFAALVTSIFLHGGWLHLAGNMLYLHIFGNNVEDAMGRLRFVVFYLLVGIAANLAQVVVSPDSPVPGIGASGAIAGVLGAYLLLYPRAGVMVLVPFFFFRIITLPAVLVLVFWFVLQVFEGTLTLAAGTAGTGGVAFWVHVAGFALGALLVGVFRNRSLTGVKSIWT